jgi:signal transduction histidine kinase
VEAPPEVASRIGSASHGSSLTAVADVFDQQRHEILHRWWQATRKQSFHTGRHKRAVADHVPALFDGLVALVRRGVSHAEDPAAPPLDDPAVVRATQQHARARLEQGLSPAEVVTEFRLLRQEIGRALLRHLPPGVAPGDVVRAGMLVDDALDGLTALALATFAQQVETRRDDLLATTVHDIQQPITGLRGYLQLALHALDRSEPDLECVAGAMHHAQELADRMEALTGTLAEASRLALRRLEPHSAPADLDQLLHRAVEQLDPDTARRVQLVIPPEADASGVWDVLLLERVIANLLSNAAKYSPPDSPIRVFLRSEERVVEVSVQDEGIGLAPGEQERLFRRYARAPGAVERGIQGLGLGLHLCRGIVEAHGGRIWAESAGRGRGTTVHVRLPRGERLNTGQVLSGVDQALGAEQPRGVA